MSKFLILSVVLAKFPAVFQGIFLWLITLCQPVLSQWLNISPQSHHTTCGHRGGRPMSNREQTMAEKTNKTVGFCSTPLSFVS